MPDDARPESISTREFARRLLGVNEKQATPESFALATQSVYTRITEVLGRWVGTDGCRALIERAHFEVRLQHPVLIHLQSGSLPVPATQDIEESARAYGVSAAADGVISMLEAVVGLLNRLIGEDLTVVLLEQCLPPGGNASTPPKGEST